MNCAGCQKSMKYIAYSIVEYGPRTDFYYKCRCGMIYYHNNWVKKFYIFKFIRLKYRLFWGQDGKSYYLTNNYDKIISLIQIPYNVTYKQLVKIIERNKKLRAFI